MPVSIRFQRILGIRFIIGDAHDAIGQVSAHGGLVVAPAAPALNNVLHDRQYRDALQSADFAIPDSALMVLIWNLIQRDRIPKVSGLKYLRALIQWPDFCPAGSSFWVMPTEASSRRNVLWLNEQGVQVGPDDVYLAPVYGVNVEDADLLHQIEMRRPRHVIIGLGGGIQERLGLYLKRNLSYKPAIHCIGAAIAFLSGDQVRIPVWVDSLGLGWLWRSASNPTRYIPRYWAARHLATMMMRYRDRSPSAISRPVPITASMPAAHVEP